MLKKRGQTSIYILIGIIIVAVIVLSFYLVGNNLLQQSKIDLEVRPELVPAKSLMESCILDIARDGADLIGLQGGKANLEQSFNKNPLVKFGDSLDLFGNGALNVNYWFYKTPNGINTVNIPSQQDLETELEDYIKGNINSCYENLKQLDVYNVDYNSDTNVDVSIKNNQILINVESPLEVTFNGIKTNLNSFSVILDVKLGKLYSLGRQIMEKENQNLFFEEMTIDMIVLYDEIPGTNVEFSCDEKTWQKSKVEDDFKKIVETNVQNVKNSGNEKYYSLGIGSTANVNFRYSTNWPFNMQVMPDNGDIMKGESIIENKGPFKYLSRFLCLNSYHFVYDVSYPVLVTLEEEGYIFQYAFMVVVDNNQARENQVELNTVNENDEFNVCEVRNHNLDVSVLGFNEDNFLLPIDDVDITFQCFSSVCDIGKTVNGRLNERFPQCLNGKIIVEKEGYDKSELALDTNAVSSVSLTLESVYTKTIKVILIDKETGTVRDVSNEIVNIEFTADNGYSYFATYPSLTSVQLREGNYKLNINVLQNGEVIIPKQEINTCSKPLGLGIFGNLFVGEKCVKQTLEEAKLDHVLIGGNSFDYRINREDLAGNNELVLYTIVQETSLTQNDLINNYDTIERNNLNNNFRLPEFV